MLLRWNKKPFSSFLKGFQWSKERNFFRRWESDFNSLLFFCEAPFRLWWCDQPENESSCSKIETIQYNMSLAITWALKGTSQEKIYQQFDLESVRSRRWLRRMRCFYKLIATQKSLYLFSLVLAKLNSLRHPNPYSVMRYINGYFSL